MQQAPEAVGGGLLLRRGGEGKEPVAVDHIKPNVEAGRSSGDHAGEEEGRKFVRDDEGSLCGEGIEQPPPLPDRGLQPGDVGDRPVGEGRLLIAHAVDDEAVDAVRGPAIAAAEGLEDDQGQAEGGRLLGGVLEPRVPAVPTGSDHPVENKFSFWV